jgi:hypothetical protein
MPMTVKELDQAYRRTYRRLITGVLIIYAAGFLLVLTVLVCNPRIASWITEATQAEMAIMTPSPEPGPTRLAQPARSARTVRSD